jgi:UrcA family protein
MEGIMKSNIPTRLTTSLIIAVSGLFLAADLAVAQEFTEEVVVRTKIDRTGIKSSFGAGATTEIIELNRYVSFADLDLGKKEDADKLDARVEAIAKESCQKLSDMFPLNRSDIMEVDLCVKRAITGANKHKEIAFTAGP